MLRAASCTKGPFHRCGNNPNSPEFIPSHFIAISPGRERSCSRVQMASFGPVWQGFGSSKNSSGSGSSDGAASLVELEPF